MPEDATDAPKPKRKRTMRAMPALLHDDTLLKFPQAEEYSNISERTLRRAVDNGRLIASAVGEDVQSRRRPLRIRLGDLKDYIAKLRRQS